MADPSELSATEQAAALLAAQGMQQADIAEAVGRNIRTIERWHAKPAFKAAVAARVEKAIEPKGALLEAQRLLVEYGAPRAARVILAVAHQTRPMDGDAMHDEGCVLPDGHPGVCREPTGAAVHAAELIAKGTGLFVSDKAGPTAAAAAVIVVTPDDIQHARTIIDVGEVDA